MLRQFIVCDVETTGFSPVKNEIIQFCGVRYNGPNPEEELCVYIKQLEPLPDKIVEITGITDEYLNANGVDPLEAYRQIMEFCAGCYIFVGHNITHFDWPFLTVFCRKHGNGGEVQALQLIDTMLIGKSLCGGRWPKLSILCNLLRIDFDEQKAHNATYDVIKTAECLFELVRKQMVWA